MFSTKSHNGSCFNWITNLQHQFSMNKRKKAVVTFIILVSQVRLITNISSLICKAFQGKHLFSITIHFYSRRVTDSAITKMTQTKSTMVPQHQVTCVTFRRLFKTRAVVLLFSEPRAASEKEKLCKLMAKKGGEIGAERGKRTLAEVFLFWISVSVKRKFPILGKPFMSFLEDLVPRGFAARPWPGDWHDCLSPRLISEQTPITFIRDWNCRFWSHEECPGRKNNFFATYVYYLELCVKMAM